MGSEIFVARGRINLIQSAVSNILVYFMSIIFKCPQVVINQIERLYHDFLCQGREASRKYHLADWASVCKSKKVPRASPYEEGQSSSYV